jgi:N-acetylglucosamine-6-phosphate deacetylase
MNILISAQELYTGKGWISEAVIEIADGEIVSIGKLGYDHKKAFPLVVPALIDLQIYGAEGKLFSEFPTIDTLDKMYQHCLAGGSAFFQPTIATQTKEIIYKAIDAVREYITSGGKGCIGLHLEGPWINIDKRGAHSASLVRKPSILEAVELVDYGKGWITMITLAPETCTPEIINFFKSNGIVVSAGHSNADYETATQFFNENISVATHLYNAMSPLHHRAPGLVGALFNHKKAMSSIIVDGYHVDYAAVKIAKKMMGERLFCITDAVTSSTTGPYQHTLVDDKYESAGTLSGSALTQIKSINNLISEVGVELGEAINMCSLYPAKVMNKENITGTIELNKKADLLCLNTDRQFLKIFTS